MTPPPNTDTQSAWSSAVTMNVALVVTSALAFLLFPVPFRSVLTWLRLAQIGFSGVLLALLARDRRLPRLGRSLAAFALGPLVQLAALPAIAVAREGTGVSFEALLRQRAMVFVIATLAPRQASVALVLIAAFAVETCVEFWIPSFGATRFGPHEPWVTLMVFGAATWIALSRARHLSRERALEQRLRRATAAARGAQVAQAVLDLANTPLQVMELQLTLLESRHRPVPPETAPIRRSLGRLRGLSKILAGYEAPKEELASFDGESLLRDY